MMIAPSLYEHQAQWHAKRTTLLKLCLSGRKAATTIPPAHMIVSVNTFVTVVKSWDAWVSGYLYHALDLS